MYFEAIITFPIPLIHLRLSARAAAGVLALVCVSDAKTDIDITAARTTCIATTTTTTIVVAMPAWPDFPQSRTYISRVHGCGCVGTGTQK